MIKKLFVFLLYFALYPIVAYDAYEMHGTLIDNSDGTYSVNLIDQTGEKHFYGNAYQQADGTLTLTINGQQNETYIGTATLEHEGYFRIHLLNNTSGNPVTGTVEVQE
jgi:hypothetical protein